LARRRRWRWQAAGGGLEEEALGSAWQWQLDEVVDPTRACSGGCSLEVVGVKWFVVALQVRLSGARVFYDHTDAAFFTELTWCMLLGEARLWWCEVDGHDWDGCRGATVEEPDDVKSGTTEGARRRERKVAEGERC
jgi:hypothetical protein